MKVNHIISVEQAVELSLALTDGLVAIESAIEDYKRRKLHIMADHRTQQKHSIENAIQILSKVRTTFAN